MLIISRKVTDFHTISALVYHILFKIKRCWKNFSRFFYFLIQVVLFYQKFTCSPLMQLRIS